jgi:acetyl-CoA C-acetyltransferase
MSNAPYYARGVRWGSRMGNTELVDGVVYDGLTDPILQVHMGINGTNVAAEEHCSRADQDAWALRSHRRAVAAIDSGTMAEEIIAVPVPGKKGATLVETDEAPRRDTSLEALARLKPVFDPQGSVTAGNAPGLNDGAAALVVASAEYAGAHGLKPLAHILGYGTAAWDTPYLAYVPAMAATNAMKKLGLAPGDLDLVEINEAFASVALISMARLGVPEDKVNVNGGAIALGHPLAASGARLVITLIHELRRRGGGIGLAALCSGTAQGDAVILAVEL